MRRLPLALEIVLILAACATVLPIFCGYEMSFILMGWLLWTRKARAAQGSDAFTAAVAHGARPIHWGVAALLASQVLSAVLGVALSEWSPPLLKALKVSAHFGVKWGLLWFVLAAALTAAARRGWSMTRLGFWLAVWMAVHFVYCVVQRQTGIDWTHGFAARLEAHRFAYGVYRVSGFMGHPLSLAYNLMLMILAASALRQRNWWAVAGLAGLTLLISGSRAVLLVIPLAVLLCEGKRLLEYWKWIAGLAALLAVGLWLEGSVVGRFGEFFDESIPWTVRFSRLVFWQAHWRMFLDHPLAGVSLAGVDQAMVHYYNAMGVRDTMYTAHNMYLQALADSGVIGLAGVLALFAGLFVSARRMRRLAGTSSGIELLAAATALSAFVQNNLRDSEFLYALWLFVALLLVNSARRATHERESPQNLEPPARDAHPAPHLPS